MNITLPRSAALSSSRSLTTTRPSASARPEPSSTGDELHASMDSRTPWLASCRFPTTSSAWCSTKRTTSVWLCWVTPTRSDGGVTRRTGKIVSVPVGEGLLGRVVNSLGQPIDGKGAIEATEFARLRPRHQASWHVSASTAPEDWPQAIALLPIGRGQRELIIGDRQTGKTAVAVDTIINQKNTDVCLHLRGHRSEAVHGRAGRRQTRATRRDGVHHRRILLLPR